MTSRKDKEKNYPQLRFPEFTDPWEQRKFSELFQKSLEKNTNLSFSRSQVLTGATMTDSDRDINSDDDYMKTYNVIHVGDILFEGHTSKQFAFGRFVLDDYRDGIVSHVFDIYRPKAKMNLSFWKYYIHDENVMRPILVRATSNARMLNALSSSEFLKQSVFVPSENEQAKIGNLLEQIDSTIALHQRKLAKLKKLKQGYLQKMFPKKNEVVPEIRFPGFTDAWEQRKLSDAVDNIGTGKSKYMLQEKSDLAKYEVLGSTSVIGYDENYDHEGDFILTARVGANAGNLYHHSGKVKITDNTVFIQGENLAFVYNLLTQFDLKKLSFGTGQPLVKASELKSLILYFPNSDEQAKIGSYFKKLDHLITLHQRKLKKLQELKKGYLQQMFC